MSNKKSINTRKNQLFSFAAVSLSALILAACGGGGVTSSGSSGGSSGGGGSSNGGGGLLPNSAGVLSLRTSWMSAMVVMTVSAVAMALNMLF